MNDHPTRPRNKNTVPGSHSVSLFRVLGIEVRLDISVIIIFMLIVVSLASGIFPRWHPDWSTALTWGTALVSGVIFFASLLAHELSHSVVSQHYGIPVPRITLFLFGGAAETSREPDTPREEFMIAIAGPLMSLAIALVCSWLAGWLAGDIALDEALAENRVDALAGLSPVATMLFWLGSINLVLAIFNMIPGFPLDGGRVFRAVIWWLTGDLVKATRWATNGGRYFGWLLMALGVMDLLGGGGIGGLWWILIGWFISSLAVLHYKQFSEEKALGHFRVRDLMRTHFEEIRADTPLPDFIDRYLLRSRQVLWPVERHGVILGVVSLADVQALAEHERREKTVRDITRPLASMATLTPQTPGPDAMKALMKAGDEPLPVVDGGKVVGLIQHSDVMKWLSLHANPPGAAG